MSLSQSSPYALSKAHYTTEPQNPSWFQWNWTSLRAFMDLVSGYNSKIELVPETGKFRITSLYQVCQDYTVNGQSTVSVGSPSPNCRNGHLLRPVHSLQPTVLLAMQETGLEVLAVPYGKDNEPYALIGRQFFKRQSYVITDSAA
ncbi:hypothetical protein AXG93_2587s1400 [Marchantia polymorpha subsp. ruderalis]|uniref:Uncharacterized protein n=1 Tax=Marchantia polymorpha subsp. ruderalis TaxID=1480154 RepID=A0A176WSC6_MARPO|nr:hypothetical protein AXG93_2587s1400 [Marchantia polymorpha subsp. ruderalis]